jgi:hypothetical protein
MKKIVVVSVCSVIVCISILCLVLSMKIKDASFLNPPDSFDKSELYGIWEASYGNDKDRLTIFEDGLFEQEYNQQPDYQYKSGKNSWHLEKFSDARIQIHLVSAHYYLAGASYFENNGWGRQLYDPFSKSLIKMENELILAVVYKQSGQLVLHHMLLGPDEGFPIFASGYYFQRIGK